MALVAVSASPAAAAVAPRWKVAGAFLGSGVTKAFTATSTTEVLIRTPGLGLNFKTAAGNCTATGKITGSAAETPGTFKEATITCTKMEVEGVPTCTVESAGQGPGTVVMKPASGVLVWLGSTGEAAGMKLRAESGTELTKFIVQGIMCSPAGEYPLTDELIGKFLPVASQVLHAEVVFPKLPKAECTITNAVLKWWSNAVPRVEQTLTQLRIKTNPTAYCGTYQMQLTSAEVFGVFPG